MMRREIIEMHLQEIERDNGVRILFAVESGSRAWGTQSPDSDWDVRFVYVHPIEWYLSVEMGRDVIEVMADDGFDGSGWDIRKALQLYSRTNMTLLEWLGSPIVYRDNKELRNALGVLLPCFFSKTMALRHYYHVALNHYRKINLEKCRGELKRYIYVLRSLLACLWIREKGTPPPVLLDALVASEVRDVEIKREIAAILQLKRASREHDKESVSEVLLAYVKHLLEDVRFTLSTSVPEKAYRGGMGKELDRLLYKIVIT